MAIQSKVLHGTVKALKEGFGFILHTDTGTDHFFHKSELKDEVFENLTHNQSVQFTSTKTEKGLKALNVRVTAAPQPVLQARPSRALTVRAERAAQADFSTRTRLTQEMKELDYERGALMATLRVEQERVKALIKVIDARKRQVAAGMDALA